MCDPMVIYLEECHTELQLSRYWGQNSYGATNPSDTTAWQQPIEYYCGVCLSLVTGAGKHVSHSFCIVQDDTIDTLPVAFLSEFYSTGNLPTIDLANVSRSSFHYGNTVSLHRRTHVLIRFFVLFPLSTHVYMRL